MKKKDSFAITLYVFIMIFFLISVLISSNIIKKSEYNRENSDCEKLEYIKSVVAESLEDELIADYVKKKIANQEYVNIPIGYYGQINFEYINVNYKPLVDYINKNNVRFENLQSMVSYSVRTAIRVIIYEDLSVDVYLSYDDDNIVVGKYINRTIMA